MVKKYLFIFLLSLAAGHLQAQSFFTTFFAGVSNYKGDLGDGNSVLPNSHPAFGVGCMYEINHRMLVRLDGTFGKLSGSDKLSRNRNRNLSFYSKINEFSVSFEYVLFDLYDYKVSPYAILGVGRFNFNPFTKNKNDLVVNLYEQNTEGQGFYKDRKPYKLTQTSIPFGGGLQWAINDDKRLALIVGIRKTFTDYLDDVSTTYVDETLLTQKRGSNAVTLAYRGGEVGAGSYPRDGAKRGNASNKDWFTFSGISYRVRLKARGGKARNIRVDKVSNNKSKTSCPKF